MSNTVKCQTTPQGALAKELTNVLNKDKGPSDERIMVVSTHGRDEGIEKVWVKESNHNLCRDYIAVWEHLLMVDDNDVTLLTQDIKRLVIQARKIILKILHYSHQGI